MYIVSYRGPGQAGGVSSGLTRLGQAEPWCFLEGSTLTMLSSSTNKVTPIENLNGELVKAHYAFCNNFLWPITDHLPLYASFTAKEQAAYRQFNILLAQVINHHNTTGSTSFIQDYQFGILPAFLASGKSMIFWHIPWPKNVIPRHLPAIMDLARAMLSTQKIGFHTAEYSHNFMRFVEQHLSEYFVDRRNNTIVHNQSNQLKEQEQAWVNASFMSSYAKSAVKTIHSLSIPHTQIVVQPLGIDHDYWTELAHTSIDSTSLNANLINNIIKSRYVLSVDRADYTKNVLERLKMIKWYFEIYPDDKKLLSFVQVCSQTRRGLPAFDEYWQKCRNLANAINEQLGTQWWQPIHWIDQSISAVELAHLYRNAQVMLINPLRDGLNLTAKEFIICQGNTGNGALALSPGAGVWHELESYATPVNPLDIHDMAHTVHETLTLSSNKKRLQAQRMQEVLRKNNLVHWWNTFCPNQTEWTPKSTLHHATTGSVS